jgi:hypothetical protein
LHDWLPFILFEPINTQPFGKPENPSGLLFFKQMLERKASFIEGA